jgi:hypothetical protein
MMDKIMNNYDSYKPRQYIIENYGPINSGKWLKEYLYANFKDHLNVDESHVEYVTLRAPLKNFKEINNLGMDSSKAN